MINPINLPGGHGLYGAISLLDEETVAGRPDNLALYASSAPEMNTHGTTRSRTLLEGRPPIAASGRSQVQAK